MYGEKIGTYRDAGEELISVKARINDPDLGILDLVGNSKTQVEEYFGKFYMQKDDLMVYTLNKTILVIQIKDKKVEWFHFIKLNMAIDDINMLPEELLSYTLD